MLPKELYELKVLARHNEFKSKGKSWSAVERFIIFIVVNKAFFFIMKRSIGIIMQIPGYHTPIQRRLWVTINASKLNTIGLFHFILDQLLHGDRTVRCNSGIQSKYYYWAFHLIIDHRIRMSQWTQSCGLHHQSHIHPSNHCLLLQSCDWNLLQFQS